MPPVHDPQEQSPEPPGWFAALIQQFAHGASGLLPCRVLPVRSGKEVLSPAPPPLRTARAPFRCMQLKHRATSLRDTARFGSADRRHPLRDAVAPLTLGST